MAARIRLAETTRSEVRPPETSADKGGVRARKVVPSRLADVVVFDESTGRGMIRTRGTKSLFPVDLAKTVVLNDRYVPITTGSTVRAHIVGKNVQSIAADF